MSPQAVLTLSPGPAQGAGEPQGTAPSVGEELTDVRGRARVRVRGAQPDQRQQDEAGGQKQGQQVEQQQETKKGEIGLDARAKEAYGENRKLVREALSQRSSGASEG